MKTIVNNYLAYDEYAESVAKRAYRFGLEQASKAIRDDANHYEVLAVIIDNIMTAFAVERANYSAKLRKEGVEES